jgi:tetratricopeptide (TPR) repeat protein
MKKQLSAISLILVFILTLTLTSCGNRLSNYYCSQAEKLESEGKYKEAIVLLDKAVEKNPKNIYAFIHRGIDKSSIEDHKGAIEDFSKVIEIDANNVLAYLNRGKKKAQLGDYIGAIEDYDKAIKIKGGNGPFYFEMVDNFFIKKNFNYDITMEEVRYERGFAGYNIDSLSLAFYDFNFCVQKNFELPTSYYMLGLIYIAYGDMENAYFALTKSEILGNSEARKMINKYSKK